VKKTKPPLFYNERPCLFARHPFSPVVHPKCANFSLWCVAHNLT